MRRRRPGAAALAVAAATAAPTMVHAGDAHYSRHSLHNLQQLTLWRKRGRRRPLHDVDDQGQTANITAELSNALNCCRGGDTDSNTPSPHHATNVNTDAAISTYGGARASLRDISSGAASTFTKARRKRKESPPESTSSESTACETQQPPTDQQRPSFKPKLIVEFDTQAVGGMEQGLGIRQKIRSRMGTDGSEWHRLPNRGPAVSISLDATPPSLEPERTEMTSDATKPLYTPDRDVRIRSRNDGGQTLLGHLIVPTRVAVVLVLQTAALLPSLLLSRRALNLTWTAIVDYFRGRVFRTTFTNMEALYLRYYEFPAATRATARLVSQMGILLGLSWAVRWWMSIVLMDTVFGPMVLGAAGIDPGMIGTSGREGGIGPGWKVGLPCHRRGKGMAWLCGFVWISLVVGIGHGCAMALSVWGGPLRLQASAQQTESTTNVLRRVILHPIIWIRNLEEWSHLTALSKRAGKDRRRGEHSFNPDPLLFPATWLPLRWLQIFAVAKAFSTNPLQYRWCSPEDGNVVIPRLMKQYLVQLALGDEWHRVFLGEKRVGLGIIVMASYFAALCVMVFTTFTLDGGAAAMLIPSVLAAIISGLFNLMIYENRMGTKKQRKALNAMGLA
ncbi:hypothetical protein ACHAXT_011838 [Thalassiosira profunda]